jgi:hypothetical protein
MNEQLPLDSATQPTDYRILKDLAAMTGLLNPEIIWQGKVQLDDLRGQKKKGQKREQQSRD